MAALMGALRTPPLCSRQAEPDDRTEIFLIKTMAATSVRIKQLRYSTRDFYDKILTHGVSPRAFFRSIFHLTTRKVR